MQLDWKATIGGEALAALMVEAEMNRTSP